MIQNIVCKTKTKRRTTKKKRTRIRNRASDRKRVKKCQSSSRSEAYEKQVDKIKGIRRSQN